MKVVEKKVILKKWINDSTADSVSVVELGAGFFNRLSAVNTVVKEKIGIEIWKPYIDSAKYDECIKIQGDVLDYRNLLKGYVLDTCMLIDILEHFEKDVAINLIYMLKEDFNKIILMIPCGKYEQNKDVTGYGAHEYQTHRSYWYDEDILMLDFNENIKDPDFHRKIWYDGKEKIVDDGRDTACYFCKWKKNVVNI